MSIELLKRTRVDYLKISSDIILNILRNPADLAKVRAINYVPRLLGMVTIAEFVENEETFAKLRAPRVDFAQGFGIARLRPLDDRTPTVYPDGRQP